MKNPKAARRKKIRKLSPDQIEQALQHVLTSTLALYVLNKSSKPMSKTIKDLADIQFNAAKLIGFIIKLQSAEIPRVDLDHALAGVFSFIPFPANAKSGVGSQAEGRERGGP